MGSSDKFCQMSNLNDFLQSAVLEPNWVDRLKKTLPSRISNASEQSAVTKLAADAGDADSNYLLSILHLVGKGVDVNQKLALVYCNRAIGLGFSDAIYLRGLMSLDGVGGLVNKHSAFLDFQTSALLNHAESSFNIAYMMHFGIGCEKNFNDALVAYEAADKLGDSGAQFNLGLIDYDRKQYESAANYFRKSSDRGNLKASYHLAHMYANGKGVYSSYRECRHLLEVASSDFIIEDACIELALDLEQGLYGDINASKSIEMYRHLAKNGNAEANYRLGRMMIFGENLEQDKNVGIEHLRLASEKGHAYAIALLERYSLNSD